MKKALLYSGGVESTLLYYLLQREAKDNNFKLNLFIVDRYNDPVIRALHLWDHLRVQWKDTISVCTVLDVPLNLNNTERMKWAIKYLSETHDEIIWGMNAYPPNIKPKFQESTMNNPDQVLKRNPKLRMPLIEKTKDKVIKEYIKYNIHHILPMTHSCGEPVQEPCGTCFNCRERAWAYDKLGLTLEKGT